MDDSGLTRAQRIGRAVTDFERGRTGRSPQSVAVMLEGDTVVVTLRGALSPAELALARTAEGAALVRAFHREVFASASEPLRQEIGRITGAEVREATAEAQGATGTLVQVFLLGGSVPGETWTGTAPLG